ncbi:uncharacterized protein LOC130893754 [Diorhabda carinulata]|uniref:uncharacterized protein LOC130893754 n=1 Tax=Diorhabda carinulata TaxID=1163345 RepID=UPI00259FF7BC|nr:uncharacterized protein LOC130893754 [Diorhabda carinulata]
MTKLFGIVIYFCIYVSVTKSDTPNYRLSSDEAIPQKYYLSIRPDIDNEIFYGETTICVKTTKQLEGITLHSRALTISAVFINQIKAIYEEISDERIIVKFDNSSIQPGEHSIKFNYKGKIGFSPKYGFIKAVYEDKEIKANVYVTDLEPIRARTVFPCFDEPAFKANFHVRLISPNDTYRGISNMPEINKFTTNNTVVYDFATSLKMSTYLLSFAFTNFPYYEEILDYKGRKVPIRVYTVNASKENNAFALNATKTALNFHSEYTNISYPLPKLDMIEYKRNESAATENWGLITFREGLLTTLRIYMKSQMKLVVFHELSHFWFGNLVTTAWWDDIWLHEGFATYFSYKLSAYDTNKQQLAEMKAFAFDDFFETEINEKSKPIIRSLPKQTDIPDMFNSLVYDKASAILLMLEDQIGEEKFRETVRRYMKKYAYSIATTNDFLSILEEVVPGTPLKSFLKSYLYQSKFPVVEVDVVNNSTYVLKQQPCDTFFNETKGFSKWTIPLTYQTDYSQEIKKLWFHDNVNELTIEEPNAKWLILNPLGNGLYKAIWSQNLWEKIIDNFEAMNSTITETVVSDAFYSFRTNKISCDILIRMMERVRANAKGKWLIFFSFNDHLRENLFCHKYIDEVKLFWSFLRRRFVETNYPRKPELREPETCDSETILHTDKYVENIKQCAAWIRENLQEKDTKTTKRKV